MSTPHRFWRVVAVVTSIPLLSSCGDDGVGDPVEDHSAYTIDSSFNVQSDFEGSQIGSLLNMLQDMSDEQDDPGKYVVDQLIDFLPTPVNWAAKAIQSDLLVSIRM